MRRWIYLVIEAANGHLYRIFLLFGEYGGKLYEAEGGRERDLIFDDLMI